MIIGESGSPGITLQLIEALHLSGARNLTIISNHPGAAETGNTSLLRDRLVRKFLCSFPRSAGFIWFERLLEEGAIELELIPQGFADFLTPVGCRTRPAKGKELFGDNTLEEVKALT